MTLPNWIRHLLSRQPQHLPATQREWQQVGNRFLGLCLDTYKLGIRPGQKDVQERSSYQALARIAQLYFAAGREEDFAGFLDEGQFAVDLWAAFLILIIYEGPRNDIRRRALNLLQRYAEPASGHAASNPYCDDAAEWMKRNAELIASISSP